MDNTNESNNANEAPPVGSSNNQNNNNITLGSDVGVPRRRIIPRRRTTFPRLSNPISRSSSNIPLNLNPQSDSTNTASNNTNSQNDTNFPFIPQNLQLNVLNSPPSPQNPVEEDSDDGDSRTSNEIFGSRFQLFSRLPFLTHPVEEPDEDILFMQSQGTSTLLDSPPHPSLIIRSQGIPLFRSLRNNTELIESDSESDEEPIGLGFPSLHLEASNFDEEAITMRQLFSRSGSRYQNEEDREEVERHRLETFQNRMESMVNYEQEEQEEQISTPSITTQVNVRSNTDSSDEESTEEEDYSNLNLLRTSVINRFRRRMFGEESSSSMLHRQRFVKMMDDRFAYYWPVIHNWDPKVPIRTGYLRFAFIPPRK